MSNAPETESDAVLAFMRERQSAVLADSIAQLSSCSRVELPAVLHALHGTVGSYQLADAQERIVSLRSLLAEGAPEDDIERAWAGTIEALRQIEAGA
jgi:hypothetical protein